MPFWLKHGRFTQNVSFARDLCIAGELTVEKAAGESRASTGSYLMLGRIENLLQSSGNRIIAVQFQRDLAKESTGCCLLF